jgi:hypothetical protein
MAQLMLYGPLLRFAPFHRFFNQDAEGRLGCSSSLGCGSSGRLHSTRIVNLDLSGAVDESSLAILFHEKARWTVVPIVSANVS